MTSRVKPVHHVLVASLLLLGLSSAALAAQGNTTITGRIVDAASGAPIANVIVTIPGTTDSVRTDTLGRFSVQSPAASSGSISMSHVNYQRLMLPPDSGVSNGFHLDAELLPAAPVPGELDSRGLRYLGVVRVGQDSVRVTFQLDKQWFDANEHRLVTVNTVNSRNALPLYGTSALYGAILITLRGSLE